MNAAVLVDGHAKGGAAGARTALENFWRRVSEAARFSPLRRGPLDVILGRWTLDSSPIYVAMDLMSRLVSPYDLNPMGKNPLRAILAETINFERLARAPTKLFITATNVRTGRGHVFKNNAVTPDVLLASACLPTMFQAVEIDGEPYWEDIRARRIDVIVVYKVDRLTRSLADFAKLVELFDAHGVSFVSVTQQFNTTTSMGRLTLNVLLSFAQFEREVTSERIRDKIAASKRKGLWVGVTCPWDMR
jgi:predicted acylesterase/phospholipase RssA